MSFDTELTNQSLKGAHRAEILNALTPHVGRRQAEQFLRELDDSIKNPDGNLRQGGTSLCWFVGRLGDIARNDPNRYLEVVKDLVKFGAANPQVLKEAFRAEDDKYAQVNLGERGLLARAIERLYVQKLGVPEAGAVEELTKRSEQYLLGSKTDVIVAATDTYAAGGVHAQDLLNSRSGQNAVLRSQVLLQWSSGTAAESDGRGMHAYHFVVIERIENGRVFFREGIKSENIGGPQDLRFHRENGELLCSLPVAVFANKTVAFYMDRQRAAEVNVHELYYNRPDITFAQLDPELFKKMYKPFVDAKIVDDKDRYRKFLAQRKVEDEELESKKRSKKVE